jgi:hypothetical protein
MSANAQQTNYPDLRGIWTATDSNCYHPDAQTNDLVVEFNITEQDGPFLRGTKSWAHEGDAVMDAAGQLVTEATETIIGVIRGDGVTIQFVEHDDPGQHSSRLIDENTLEDVYSEAGGAAAICLQTMVRQPS